MGSEHLSINRNRDAREEYPMKNESGIGLEADLTLSRRRLVRESALAASALALGSQRDVQTALAQDAAATPAASPSAGRVLDFDIPGLAIGVAAYSQIPTGCTAFIFD